MALWELVMYEQHPENPDLDMYEVEELQPLTDVPVMLCSMGEALALLRDLLL